MNIFPLVQLLLIFEINLINQEINFKNHSNTVILCKLEKTLSNMHMSRLILFHYIFIILFVLNFAMKLKDDNYKSHWNILVFYDQLKMIWICSMEKCLILFHFTWVHFSHKTEKFRFWKPLKYFNIFWQKNDIRFVYVLSNTVWFGLSKLFEQNFGKKLRNTDFKFTEIV